MSDRFSSSNGTGGDIFGRSLDLSGDTLLVGASRTDRLGFTSTGSVYRFERGPHGFVEAEEWIAFDAAQTDEFGEALAIDGDWAVVGSRWDDDHGANSGAVYLWQRVGGTWLPGPKLTGSAINDGDLFGAAVGIAEGATVRLAVGAYWHASPAGSTGGAVYIYEYDPGMALWNEVQVLHSSDIVAGDFFGQALAFDGDRLVVGAPAADPVASSSGAVYVFDHDGTQFVETHKLLGSDLGTFDSFGRALSLDGDRLAVTGRRAYVYDLQGGSWVEQAILTGSGVTGSYGDKIDLEGDLLVVTESYFGSDGGAWVFQSSGGLWSEIGMTTQETAGDSYGRNAVLDGDFVLVSADSANVNGNGATAGEVYAYALSGTDCNSNGTADACEIFAGSGVDANSNGVLDECEGGPSNYCSSTPNSTGSAATIAVLGSTSVGTNGFNLTAGPVPNGAGLFFYGTSQIDIPLGNGRLCIGSPHTRLPVVFAAANQANYTYDLTAPPNLAALITAGSTWNFQFWFRDPGVGANFDLSDAISVPFTP